MQPSAQQLRAEVGGGERAGRIRSGAHEALGHVREDVYHGAPVLVGEDAHEYDAAPAGHVAAYCLRCGGDALGVVAAVRHEERGALDELEPRRPDGGGKALTHALRRQVPAGAAEGIECRERHGGVFQLVRAEQADGVLLALEAEALALDGVRERLDFGEIRKCELRAGFCGGGAEHRGDAFGLLVAHGAAALEYAGFLGGNGLHAVPEDVRVVEPDVGDDGAVRAGDGVGGVQPAAQAHLQHGDVRAAAGEPEQGRGRQQLELRAGLGHPLRGGGEGCDHAGELRVRYLHAVQPHALVHAQEVGRGVEPRPVSRGAERGGDHHAGGALAVGAGHVYEAQGALRVAKAREQLLYAPQPRLHAQAGDAADVSQSLLIVHKHTPMYIKGLAAQIL